LITEVAIVSLNNYPHMCTNQRDQEWRQRNTWWRWCFRQHRRRDS